MPVPDRTREVCLLIGLVILSVSAYAGTINHDLVWDDPEIVLYVDSIVREGGLPALVTSQFATHIEEGYVSGYYRPLVLVSLWFDSHLAGGLAWAYHLTNIILHAVNTILVLMLLRLIAGNFPAALGAMIFAVHPVHSESVAFVSGRTDLWAAFFVLVAALLWARERRALLVNTGR